MPPGRAAIARAEDVASIISLGGAKGAAGERADKEGSVRADQEALLEGEPRRRNLSCVLARL